QLAALKTALLWQICPSRQLLALSTQKPVKHFFNYFCRGEQLRFFLVIFFCRNHAKTGKNLFLPPSALGKY
ncbi:hypothetical protein, partial [Ferrovum myxofaciens]|uniref:hypothetical protein n=1 Tax=Ferrovum myxofaciens TaxID=416213 RepID=UPI001F34B034